MIVLCLTACSTSIYQQATDRDDLVINIAQGAPFLHRVVQNSGVGKTLHVYLEGDGKPWLNPYVKSTDPSPKNPVALGLFLLDPGAAIYLGRPCYFQLDDPACTSNAWWTEQRYSADVVESLSQVINQYKNGYQRVELIGYSGGGVLAFLLAASRNDVDSVVTIAANLDIAAWAEYHHYSPLAGSANPAQFPPLNPDIVQLHLVADGDQVVPLATVAGFFKEQPSAQLRRFQSFDHRCCWQQIWPQILLELDSSSARR